MHKKEIFTKKLKRIGILFLMLIVIAAPITYLLLNPKEARAGWYDGGWAFRKRLTVDSSKIKGSHSQFPVLVNLTDTSLATNAQSTGNDIMFTASDGRTKLSHELESFNSSTGQVVAWVVLSTLASPTDIYMYYGNPVVSAQENPSAVWDSNFRGVFHFKEGSGTTAADKTSYANDLTLSTAAWTASAKIGNGWDGNGARWVSRANDADFDFTNTDNLTLSLWAQSDSATNPGGTEYVLAKQANGGTNAAGYAIYYKTTGVVCFGIDDNASGFPREEICSASDVYDASWHHIVVTKTGTTRFDLYVDGSLVSSDTSVLTGSMSNTMPLYIGDRNGADGGDEFTGDVDEVRIARSVRSADWIYTEYATQTAAITASPTDEYMPTILHWKFDEGYGTTANDSTDRQLSGTFGASTAAPTWATEDQCVLGKCLKFDGSNDYITRTYNSSTDASLAPATSSFSTSVWIRHNTTISADQIILSRADGAAGVGWKLYMNSSGQICFGIDGTAGSFPSDSACSTKNYADNQWHYIRALKSGTSSINLYVDGAFVKQTTPLSFSTSISGTNAPLYVGIDANGTGNAWNGWIDDVKIYRDTGTSGDNYTAQADRNSTQNAAVIFGGANPYASLSNGLAGYWKFDETSGNAADTSGQGSNLTNINTTPYVAGKFAGGGDFEQSSSQYQYVTDNAALSITGSLTLTAWIKPESTTASTQFDIAGKWDGSNESYLLSQYGDELRFYYDSASTYAETSAANVQTGVWYNVAAVYDAESKQARIYVNGTELALTYTGTFPATIGDDAGRFQIGAEDSSTTAANFYDGIIDDVRVYNRSLQGSEARALYDWGPTPVAHWKLDEGSGTTANDSSGNANVTSTFTNNTSWTNGKYGNALTFDGTDDVARIVEATTTDLGTTTQSYSLGAWIKTTTNYSGNATIIAKDDGSGAYPFSLYLNSSEFACFQISDGTNSPSTCSATALNDGNWHYIAGVRDVSADTLYIFVDGIQLNSTADTTTATAANNDDLSIGSSGTSYIANDFNGVIDDVRLYNYPRSQKQIIVDMNAGQAVVGNSDTQAAGYWKFDEGKDTTANNAGSCASTCNGTLTSFASPATTTSGWTNSGKFARAIIFDGTDDYITMGNVTALSPTQTTTVSAWIAPTAADKTIISKFDTGTNNRSYRLHLNASNLIEFTVSNNGTATTTATGTTAISTTGTTWYHIAGVYDGNYLRVFVNGREEGSTAYTSGIYAGNAATVIGASLNSGARANLFTGSIDEVKIYPIALSSDEVKIENDQGGSAKLGTTSTTSDGTTSSDSFDRSEWCPVGETDTCNAPTLDLRFDEKSGTTTYDSSGQSNHGTFAGNTNPTYVRGQKNWGISMNTAQASYVTVANASQFNFTGAFTIAGWFNLTSFQRNADTLMEKGALWGFTRSGNTGRIIFKTSGLSSASLVSSATVVDSAWHFIVGVWDGSTKYIYIDSLLDTSGAATGTLSTNTNPLIIGEDSPGGGGTFVNKFDDLRIYNYARTRRQLAWDYNKGAPIAWYKLDECTGSTAYDASGRTSPSNGTINITSSGSNTSTGNCNANDSAQAWSNGTNGKWNSALDFDGTDDYVSVSDTAILRFDNAVDDFSLFAWVKRTTTGTEYILSKEDADNDGWRLMIDASNLVVCSQDATDVSSSSSITDTNWHLIGCTIDRDGNGQVYIDGVANGAAVAMGTDAMATTSAIRIGTRSYTSTSYFNGLIDDVRIYPYAITAAQAKTLYYGGAAIVGPTSGLP